MHLSAIRRLYHSTLCVNVCGTYIPPKAMSYKIANSWVLRICNYFSYCILLSLLYTIVSLHSLLGTDRQNWLACLYSLWAEHQQGKQSGAVAMTCFSVVWYASRPMWTSMPYSIVPAELNVYQKIDWKPYWCMPLKALTHACAVRCGCRGFMSMIWNQCSDVRSFLVMWRCRLVGSNILIGR